MYDDAMNGVTSHLIRRTPHAKLVYTSELIPQRNRAGNMYVPSLAPILTLIPRVLTSPPANAACGA